MLENDWLRHQWYRACFCMVLRLSAAFMALANMWLESQWLNVVILFCVLIPVFFEDAAVQNLENMDPNETEAISTPEFPFVAYPQTTMHPLEALTIYDPSISCLKSRSPTAEEISAEEQCSICHEAYVKTDRVLVLACGHAYHDKKGACIRKWFEISRTCPLCRNVHKAIPLVP